MRAVEISITEFHMLKREELHALEHALVICDMRKESAGRLAAIVPLAVFDKWQSDVQKTEIK